MRGILIDPKARTVTEVEVEKGLDALYSAVSFEGLPKVDDIEAVTLYRPEHGDILTAWIDGEGMLKPDIPVFRIPVMVGQAPIAGKALLLNTDRTGESVSTDANRDGVASLIEWSDEVSSGELGPYSEERGQDGSFIFHMGKPILKKAGEDAS